MSPRRWFWPLNAWYVVLPAVAVLLIVTIGTAQMWSWPYLHWSSTSTQWHQQFTWAAPAAASAAALWAVRMNRVDRLWVQPQAHRMGAAVVVRQLGMLCAWLVGAYSLGMMPLTITTVGSPGSPDLLAMASGPLAMAAAVAIGYAIGTMAGSLVAVPVVAIVVFLIEWITAYGAEDVVAIAPKFSLDPMPGQVEPTPLAVFRLVLFATVAGVCGALVATVLRWRAQGRSNPLLSAGAVGMCAAPVLALGAIGLADRPVMYEVRDSGPPVCETVHGIDYCVHPDNQRRLDGMIQAFDEVIARYGTTPTQFSAVWDKSLMPNVPMMGQPTPDGKLIARLEPNGTVDVLSSGVHLSLLSFTQCPTAGPGKDVVGLYMGLENYLHDGKPTHALSTLEPTEVQHWIRQHHDQIANCSLTAQDVPT